ncbi:MAG: hypothetical protein ACI9H6_000159 [Patiriisocius sp.]|jgi:hypothetical protein
MKNNVPTTTIYTEVAKKLGLTVEVVQGTPTKKSLLISNDQTFCLLSKGYPGFYPTSRRSAGHFTVSKMLTQKVLKKYGYNVIKTREVRLDAFSSAKEIGLYAAGIRQKFPVLTKPDRGYDGIGITISENAAQLSKVAKKYYKDSNDFLIQPLLDQNEYRILVIDNDVVLMHSKHNQSVVGDGKSTIKQLLSEVKESAKDTAYIALQHKVLKTKPSTILEEGAKFKYHLIRLPSAEYYKTEKFPPALKKWAKKLAQTLSTSVVGIDVFIPGDITDTDSYLIIELNSEPATYYLPKRCNDETTAFTIAEKVLRSYFKLK